MSADTEISHEKAVETDTTLARLSGLRIKKVNELERLRLSIARSVGIRPTYVTKTRREVRESLDELVKMLEVKLDNDNDIPAWDRKYAERDLDKVAELKDEIGAIDELSKPLNDLYAQHRWQRFFLVTNQNGHIHSSMNCHSCNIRTQFSWLPQLSGLTEKDAVDVYGPRLCTHCFPSAPVEWTMGVQKDESDVCPGTRDYDAPSHTGYYRGNWATCKDCGQRVTVTSTGKLRKHKKAEA